MSDPQQPVPGKQTDPESEQVPAPPTGTTGGPDGALHDLGGETGPVRDVGESAPGEAGPHPGWAPTASTPGEREDHRTDYVDIDETPVGRGADGDTEALLEAEREQDPQERAGGSGYGDGT